MERAEVVEQILMIAATGTILVFAFGYREAWYLYVLLPLVLAAMVVILVRRWRRMNRAFEEAREQLENDSAPGLPFVAGPQGQGPVDAPAKARRKPR